MLGKDRIKETADGILARSSADQTEVVILAGDSALTRFANSSIHQNVAETNAEVRIRVVLKPAGTEGARVGVATTNSLDETALGQALEKALAIARLQPLNPDFRSLPASAPAAEVSAYSGATAVCTPESRAHAVGTICLLARDAGLLASGALKTAVNEVAVANSLGVWAYHTETMADISTVVMSDTSAAYAAALALDVTDLDFGPPGARPSKSACGARIRASWNRATIPSSWSPMPSRISCA
jgi:PmbA protein